MVSEITHEYLQLFWAPHSIILKSLYFLSVHSECLEAVLLHCTGPRIELHVKQRHTFMGKSIILMELGPGPEGAQDKQLGCPLALALCCLADTAFISQPVAESRSTGQPQLLVLRPLSPPGL